MTKEKKIEKINFSSVSEFAAYELHRAGLTKNEDPRARKIAESVLAFIKRFEKQNHDQETGNATLDIFNKLITVTPLTPITDDPDEWERFESKTKREDEEEETTEVYYQNRRVRRFISRDEGKSYTDGRDGKEYRSAEHKPAEEPGTNTAAETPAEEQSS